VRLIYHIICLLSSKACYVGDTLEADVGFNISVTANAAMFQGVWVSSVSIMTLLNGRDFDYLLKATCVLYL